MRRLTAVSVCLGVVVLALVVMPGNSSARPPIRSDFFGVYPSALGSSLDELPSDSKHCGVCHFEFGGGGARNPYGLAVEVGINGGLSNTAAVLAIEGADSDADGFTNVVEINDIINFSNTPTFPGLSAGNVNSTSGIPLGEIAPFLTPSGGSDTTPPTVTVTNPNGGEIISGGAFYSVNYTATDASGIVSVSVLLSDDGGLSFSFVAQNQTPTGVFDWFVPNLPGPANLLRVVAVDGAGNPGEDDSDTAFTIQPVTGGLVATTLRDLKMPGTQPFEGAVLDDVESTCRTCHGDYDTPNEPWANWNGSMMGQSMRDPLFLAALAIAEQDAPSSGDLCIRCHSPGGWQNGRSVDTGGGLLTAVDRQGVSCDFCHRMVDPVYEAGISPPQDVDVLAALSFPPTQAANGQFINDPAPLRRGPFADAQASHDFVESPFHTESDLCATCHDVSNPVFEKVGDQYVPGAFDAQAADADIRTHFPVERTFSEWTQSTYATSGVFAPQFAGNKPDGMVSSCQDCHMRDVDAKGCNDNGAPRRADMPLHDFTGGNTFIPDVLADLYPGEVNPTDLAASKVRATAMLQLAATLEAVPTPDGIRVKVTNETGHKLPSGYPEGRRIWLEVEATDGASQTVFQSGHYEDSTGDLIHDSQIKVYETHPGLSPGLAGALGLPVGPSFHFVLNDTVYSDNRIPPRGFTNANFEAIQSPPVHYTYADGQYWDETDYVLPASAEQAEVTLYYQTTTKEYVTFLRDANTTNSAGQTLYDAWLAHGMSEPVMMAQVVVPVTVTGVGDQTIRPLTVYGVHPNPVMSTATIDFFLPEEAMMRVEVFDVRGARVAVLYEGRHPAGRHSIRWDRRDALGLKAPAGLYLMRVAAGDEKFSRRMVVLH